MNQDLDKLSFWYHLVGVFGAISSMLIVFNFLRIQPLPHLIAIFIIILCAIIMMGISFLIFRAGTCVQKRENYDTVITASYVLMIVFFPLGLILAINSLKTLKKEEVIAQFNPDNKTLS
jgi:heme/copper-type cytochrome/quinol oxidase subunit 4